MSTYNQYTKLRFCFPFLSHKAFTIRRVICTLSTSPVAGVTFHEFSNHTWLVATVLEAIDIEQSHHHRKFYWTESESIYKYYLLLDFFEGSEGFWKRRRENWMKAVKRYKLPVIR